MKVLLQRYGNKFYVWKDAEFENGYFMIDGFQKCETEVVAVKDTEGVQYVICNYCGEKIPDNPESIERHFAEKEAKKDCFTCNQCAPMNLSNKKVLVVKNDDDTYAVTETCTSSSLQCKQSWRDLDHPSTQRQCLFNQCRRNGTSPHGSILMKYPDLFETQITNDLLLKKKYEYSHDWDYSFMYDLKCRKTLFAMVNEVGIVECFMLDYQYRRTIFFYSAKYNKLFYSNNGNYREGKPSWVTQTKYDQIKARIEGLYKGVKVDE